jgi:hypothetical protein
MKRAGISVELQAPEPAASSSAGRRPPGVPARGLVEVGHRVIGLLLGYPECCVEAFVADRVTEVHSAIERGTIAEHFRSDEEIARLIAAGVPPRVLDGDTFKRWVPCERHVGAAGWEAFE